MVERKKYADTGECKTMKARLLTFFGAYTLALGTSTLSLIPLSYGYVLATAFPVFAAITPPSETAPASMVSEIGAYEQKFFDRSFTGETSDRRLVRLETFIFGATSTGSAKARIARIAQVVPLPTTQPAKAVAPPSTRQSQPTVEAAEPALESPGHYPHITALEAKILGQTYDTESISERLSRLETKVFGAPSKGKDLEQRTDALDRHMQAGRRPNDMIIGTRLDDVDEDDEILSRAEKNLPRYQSVAPPQAMIPPHFQNVPDDPGAIIREEAIQQELADAQKTAPPTKEERTLSRIAWCEQQVFGHAYPEMHLLKRLHQLNHELNPTENVPDIQLMDQIDAIVKEVVLRKQPHQPSTT
jgi:hypothetical protein